jgi:hypothetical protein
MEEGGRGVGNISRVSEANHVEIRGRRTIEEIGDGVPQRCALLFRRLDVAVRPRSIAACVDELARTIR